MGAGFAGFLVVLALIVGAVFLFRSMNRHLRNVPKTFEPPPPPEPTDEKPTTGQSS